MATAKSTTDHDEIRNWVESRGGHPARVKETGSSTDPGVLRIDFPGFSGEDTLEEIEWDQFFEWFDRDGLALLISEEEGNRFNKLVSRETPAPTRSAARKAASRRAGTKSSSRRVAKSSSTKKAASAKKASSAKKAATSTKKASSSKKASSAKKASSTRKASTKKASSSKKASTKKASTKKAPTKKAPSKKASAKKASSSTRRLAGSTTSKKAGTKKAASKKASSKKASGKLTTNHDEIRRWVEARGGYPAHVKQTGRKRGDLGVLRIDYPGYSGKDTLERVDWEDWFAAFDRNKLAFLHDNKRNSRFSKLVNR